MNREAAVLGTPAYTVFRGRLAGVDQYLVDLGRLVRLADRSQISLLRFESGYQRLPSLCDPSLAATVANLILEALCPR
jgi:predicted glycosyltransferase